MLLVALCISWTPVAISQQPAPARLLEWAYRDPGRLVRSADSRTALVAVGALAALGTVSLLDRDITHSASRGYNGAFKQYLDATNHLGERIVLVPVTGLLGVSLLTDNARFQDAAFTSFQSAGMASVLILGVKAVVGRHRPDETDSPFVFSPFSGETSFPSGHTTLVTAVLVPWALYYNHPIVWGLVAAGVGGTAMARIAMRRHWASDVLAGGLVGTSMAIGLARLHRTDAPPGHSLRIGASMSGLALIVHF